MKAVHIDHDFMLFFCFYLGLFLDEQAVESRAFELYPLMNLF